VDHSRGLTFDVVDDSTSDTIYAMWNRSSTDVIDHTAGGVLQPFVDYDMPEAGWMHVEIVLDQVNDTFDLMIGGEVLLDDAGLWNPANAVDLISWSTHTLNGVFVDNIHVGIELALLLGDANQDGLVTGADLISVQQNFAETGAVPLQGDANHDGLVTGADLISVQQNFGKTLGPAGATVPEPATAALLIILGMMRRR
jgi:hypothetical protein